MASRTRSRRLVVSESVASVDDRSRACAQPGGEGGSASRPAGVAAHGAPRVVRTVVPRDRLFDRIEASDADVVAVIAGPGYGKTTLLAGMAERVASVAWLSLDTGDDDPAVLLADLALALDETYPLDHALLWRLTSRGSRVPAMRVRELTRAMEHGSPSPCSWCWTTSTC